MIDIHHHLLWGLDDGAKDIETSLAMAKIAVADGITHVVCTPHANSNYNYEAEVVEEKIAELQRLLDREHVALKLGRGCDFHLSYDNIEQAEKDPSRFSINGMGYLMVEIPDFGMPQGLTEVFYQLQLASLMPVLTHPERNPTLQADPERMKDWIRGGLLVQVTAGSIVGQMGKVAQRMSHQMLADRWVHFVATDAHNTTTRPPKMRAAFELIASKYGEEYAHALCVSNPLAAFQGAPLLPQAEPLHLYEDLEEKSWWQKLLRR